MERELYIMFDTYLDCTVGTVSPDRSRIEDRAVQCNLKAQNERYRVAKLTYKIGAI